MGRSVKQNLVENIDRREVGYYSTPKFVADFIAQQILELRPGAKFVLDPCIGQGELTVGFKEKGCRILGHDIIDMSPKGCDEFIQGDFLKIVMQEKSLFSSRDFKNKKIDIIVANPPYNCHEVDYIKHNKQELAQFFGKPATLNMYALFIHAILDYAPDDCVIGLVTHDSFFTAIGHRDLRQKILDTCIIHNVHLCPTDLFLNQGADVRTCLMILEKNKKPGKTKFSNRPRSTQEFERILMLKDFEEDSFQNLLLTDERDNFEFVIDVAPEILNLFSGRRVIDIAPCITGISTGDDKRYIRSEESKDFSIPFYKNPASRNFFSRPDGYLCTNYEEVGKSVHNFMIRNRDLLLRGGLACSSMGVKFGATIRPSNTVCGVNPNIIVEGDSKWWLLSFLNSRLSLYLARGIIIRGNMITAGYAARIPVPEFNKLITKELIDLGKAGYKLASNNESTVEVKNRINDVVESYLGLSNETQNSLRAFERNPTYLA